MYTSLISTSELADHLSDPDWIIIDARFDLNDKDWGEEEYAQLHIPGAVFAHQERDLCGKITPVTGRHPMPETEQFVHTLRRMGINNDSQVVVYDTTGGGMAGRLWFLLKLFNHKNVALLDGGLPAWLSENRPVKEGVETNPFGTFAGKPTEGIVVTTDAVKKIIQYHTDCLLDSRAPERYRGEIEPIDPVAGRIPGALNRFYGDNLDKSGRFLPPEQIREAFIKVIGANNPNNVVVYCGSGTTACLNLFAMTYAGFPMPKIYIGSWSEWVRDPENPVEKG